MSGVSDGKTVNIPLPSAVTLFGGHRRICKLFIGLQFMTRKGRTDSGLFDLGTGRIHTGEKSPLSYLQVIVLHTDTGGLVEQTKARERTLAKELGKMVP